MKRQIRRGAFETNSSSTHAICISKGVADNLNLPKHVTFTHDEFGWTFDVHRDTWTKASYLYQAICDCNDGDEKKKKLDRISEVLEKHGVGSSFEPDKDAVYGDGYIDHAYDTVEFVNAVLEDEEKLLKYLFGDSFIVTGNDNGDSFHDYMHGRDAEYSAPYLPEFDNYDIYEKWN